jgi:hypothetical protein
MSRAISAHPLYGHSCRARPGGDESESPRAIGQSPLPFTPPERPDRAGRLATRGNLPVLDDLRFAQLANYGAIPDTYPRPHPEQPVAWPERMGWAALAVAVMVLALVLTAIA